MNLANILSTDHSASNKQLTTFQPGTRKKLEHFSYALTDIIGKGYSSQVFKGKNDLTSKYYHYADEPVAIKVIDMKMLKCEVNRSLLANEIENLK
jgi:serine/threonine-protein kinase ULK/ATG1